MTRTTATVALAGFLFAQLASGFRSTSPWRSRFTSPPQKLQTTASSTEAAAAPPPPPPPPLLEDESVASLFGCLAESYALLDPSGGTCCRNSCSGCQFYNADDATFLVTEFSSPDDSRAWIPSYSLNTIGHLNHVSSWADVLFGGEEDAATGLPLFKSTTSRSDFDTAIDARWAAHHSESSSTSCGSVIITDEALLPEPATVSSSDASPPARRSSRSRGSSSCSSSSSGGGSGGEGSGTEAPAALKDALWLTLGTRSAPVLSRSAVAQRFSAIAVGGGPAAGGKARVVPYAAFRTALLKAANEVAKAAAKEGAGGGSSSASEVEAVDYEGMETVDLMAKCAERGITSPPPMKRLIIEELRFFDENGRPGKRNKVTRQLE